MPTPLMDKPEGQIQICGYRLATGPLCHADTVDRWCAHHSQEQFLTCCSCGEPALQECPAFTTAAQIRCGMPLCERCEHKLGVGHVRRRSAVEVARDELAAALLLALREAAHRQLVSFTEANGHQLATWLIDQLTTSITLKMLSGLATPPDAERQTH
jgi:hypothetical protein